MRLGKYEWKMDRPYIMGILNVTPDSFSDGGRFCDVDAAVRHALRMREEGADIIDIGGESTRPGSVPVSAEQEMERIMPVLDRLVSELDIPVSVDTYKAEVANEALNAGAGMINDVRGSVCGFGLAEKIMSQHPDAAVCIMHNRAGQISGREREYSDVVEEVCRELGDAAGRAMKCGVRKEQILLDPGIGFAKSAQDNLRLIGRLEEVTEALQYPFLLGISRKSVIGHVLDLPEDERLEGTVALNVVGLMKGCSVFRVHDVKENVRALRMAWAVRERK